MLLKGVMKHALYVQWKTAITKKKISFFLVCAEKEGGGCLMWIPVSSRFINMWRQNWMGEWGEYTWVWPERGGNERMRGVWGWEEEGGQGERIMDFINSLFKSFYCVRQNLYVDKILAVKWHLTSHLTFTCKWLFLRINSVKWFR